MTQLRKQVGEQRSGTPSLRAQRSSGRSYGRVSIELRISQGDLRASVRGKEDWAIIKDILDVLGFDVKFVNVMIARDQESPTHHADHSGPRSTVVEIKKIQRDSPSRASLMRSGTTGGVKRRIR